jgi:hypothetical protein
VRNLSDHVVTTDRDRTKIKAPARVGLDGDRGGTAIADESNSRAGSGRIV